jgi:MFS family permease
MERGASVDAARGVQLHGRRYYILALLLLVSILNFVDRNVIGVLVQPIKHDLKLSDSQLGFLTGTAFALTYVLLVIPAARLADRWSRRKVIAIAMLTWSIMTMACGVAQTAVQLFAARFGVGFGEGGSSPASQALVSDLYPRTQRATALAVLALCAPLGTAIGLSFGDWALRNFDWRTTFILAGLPGLIVVPLVLFTIPDVPKGLADAIDEAPPTPSLLSTIPILWRIRTFRYLVFSSATQTILTTGLTSSWLPAFLARSHHLAPGTSGTRLGFALAAGIVIGSLIGGPLVDWLGRRDLRRQLWFGVLTSLASGAAAAGALLAPTPDAVFALLSVMTFFGGMFSGPLFAISLTLAPVAARATASACMLVIINLTAIGIAPQVVGNLSDLFAPAFGEESLRIALLCATLMAIPTALFFLLASFSYRGDVAEAAARDHALEAG